MKIGERVGDYEVLEVLGNGGMGEVYKVRNLLSERLEAMKVLLPNLAGDPGLAERFLREIKLQASLDHPNIAKLHTAFRDSNQLLMIMEFVEGVSVEKLLAHGALLTHDAINYTSQVLNALAYAHARGVVHRDIKPANLMRTPAETIKLLDFGIAHMKADHKLTQPGTTLGSLYYIAPELINGSEPDHRCDIYSLGVVLYEMVTGSKPFQGDSQYSILSAHVQSTPVAPAEAAPWVAGPLNDVILKAMAKDPAHRFQSAEAFKNEIEKAADPAPDQAATIVMPSAPTQALPQQNAPVVSQVKPDITAPMQTPPPAVMASPVPQLQPAPPVPPPQAAIAPMPPPQTSVGHRGLYVALGCLLTLAVLAAAAIETPKFFKTHADQSPRSQAAIAHPVSPAQDQSAVSIPLPTSEDKATQSIVVAADQPSQAPQLAASSQPDASQPAPKAAPVKAAGQQVKAPQQEPVPPTSGPSAEAQESFRAQMHELQEQADELNVRAKTARTGLISIKSQMAGQGLGLRSDVLEAEAHMNHLLDKAQREIASGDAVSAEHDLQMAGYSVDFIERFLGH
jgi:serine/threonine protein kinase